MELRQRNWASRSTPVAFDQISDCLDSFARGEKIIVQRNSTRGESSSFFLSFFLFFPSLRKARERRRALAPFNRDFYGWKASLVDRNLCRMNVNFTNRDSYSARIGCYVLPRVLPRDFLKKIICMRQKYVAKHHFGWWKIKDRRKKIPFFCEIEFNRIAEKKKNDFIKLIRSIFPRILKHNVSLRPSFFSLAKSKIEIKISRQAFLSSPATPGFFPRTISARLFSTTDRPIFCRRTCFYGPRIN